MSLYTYLMIKKADPRNLNRSEYADSINVPATKKTRAREDKAGNPYISGETIKLPTQIGTPGTVFRDDGAGTARRPAAGYHYKTEDRDIPIMTAVPGYGYFADDYPTVPGLPFASEVSAAEKKHIKELQRKLDRGEISLDSMLFGKSTAPDNPYSTFDKSDLTSVGSYEDAGWFTSKRKPMWDKGKWNWAQDGRYTPGIMWDTPKYGPDNQTYDTMARAIAELGDKHPLYRDLFMNDYRTEEKDERLPDGSVRHTKLRIPMALPALKKYRPDVFKD